LIFGVDIKTISALVLAGSGKSSVKSLQRIGRVIRSSQNKDYSAVIDFYDQTKFLKKHSILRYKIYSEEQGFIVHKSKEMK